MILDEFILAGEIQETSKKARFAGQLSGASAFDTTASPRQVILERMEELEKLEAQDSGGLLERLGA